MRKPLIIALLETFAVMLRAVLRFAVASWGERRRGLPALAAALCCSLTALATTIKFEGPYNGDDENLQPPGDGPTGGPDGSGGSTGKSGGCKGAGSEWGAFPTTGSPVDLFSRQKREHEVDLTVLLSGTPLTIARDYFSGNNSSGPGAGYRSFAGERWSLSVFTNLGWRQTASLQYSMDDIESDDLTVNAHALGHTYFKRSADGSVWQPTGATTQRITTGSLSFLDRNLLSQQVVTRPMFVLEEPGEFKRYYYHRALQGSYTNEGLLVRGATSARNTLTGLPAVEEDPRGNRKYFEYYPIPTDTLGRRLRTIWCVNSGGALEARVDFVWQSVGSSGSEAGSVRLRMIRVFRMASSPAPSWVNLPPTNGGQFNQTETSRVVYLYNNDLSPETRSANPELGLSSTNVPGYGSDGDALLLQVCTFERVDQGDGVMDEFALSPTALSLCTLASASDLQQAFAFPGPARVRVSQYRYYGERQTPPNTGIVQSNCAECTTIDQDLSPALQPGQTLSTFYGNPGQLKLTLNPASIEWYAQRKNTQSVTRLSVLERALSLLTAKHTDVVLNPQASVAGSVELSSPELRFIDLVDKLIGYNSDQYSADGGYGVSVQYGASAGCGCSGVGSSGALSRRFTYKTYTFSSPTNPIERSVAVSEAARDASGVFVEQRVRRWDLGFIGNSGSTFNTGTGTISGQLPYVINEVLSAGSLNWVTHYEYLELPTPLLARKYMPSSVDRYTPAVANGATGPQTLFKNNTGVVYRYTYNGDRRLVETRVTDGGGSTAAVYSLVEQIVYPATPGSGERRHLPNAIRRFRTSVYNSADASPDDIEETSYAYGFFQNSDGIAWMRTSVEREKVAENGPTAGGSPALTSDSFSVFDQNGQLSWSVAPDGSVSQYLYAPGSGRQVESRQNTVYAGPTSGDYAGLALASAGWGRAGDGGTLVVRHAVDNLGREIASTGSDGVASYITRVMRAVPGKPGMSYYTEIRLDETVAGATPTPVGVRSVTASDDLLLESQFSLGEGGYTLAGASGGYAGSIATISLGTELSRRRQYFGVSRLLEASARWTNLAADRSSLTRYFYDPLGRQSVTVAPNLTATRSVFDAHDREIERGITAVAEAQVSAALVTLPSLFTQTHAWAYDTPAGQESGAGQGAGDGKLRVERVFPQGNTDVRLTIHRYDGRNRRVATINSLPPHEFVQVDNLDRPVRRGLYSSDIQSDPAMIAASLASESSFRLSLEEMAYSQRGLEYRARVALNPTLAPASATWLETHSWYDSAGRRICSWGPSAPAEKTVYDGLGRPKAMYITDRGGDAAPGAANSFEDASSLAGDIVLEQTETHYIASNAPRNAGKVRLQAQRLRAHNATATGDLAAAGASQSVTMWTGSTYDDLGRTIQTIDFGANVAG